MIMGKAHALWTPLPGARTEIDRRRGAGCRVRAAGRPALDQAGMRADGQIQGDALPAPGPAGTRKTARTRPSPPQKLTDHERAAVLEGNLPKPALVALRGARGDALDESVKPWEAMFARLP